MPIISVEYWHSTYLNETLIFECLALLKLKSIKSFRGFFKGCCWPNIFHFYARLYRLVSQYLVPSNVRSNCVSSSFPERFHLYYVSQFSSDFCFWQLVLLVRMDSIVRTNVHVKTTPLVIQYLDFVIVLRDSREFTAKKVMCYLLNEKLKIF